jgi:oxygen-independent coproporphyrinogen-3 oxidase
MLSSAMRVLMDAGYVYVGMDHFALPTDALAVAKRQGRLHRNFQGYSTQPDCDLIALGVSSIGRVGPTFSQNVKTLDEYYDLLNQGRLPVARGMVLTRDDLVRRTVIMALMCQGSVLFESVELSHLVNFKQYFATEMTALVAMQEEGLLTLDDSGIQVTELGWFFVRGVAMVFDKYLQANQNRARFSKII